ncbi:MAG TPA: TrkA family potassium uptake protein [Chloroflexota bacterium]|nr:TrkA family potassium uptake protein [Chloroflexota bacterium]
MYVIVAGGGKVGYYLARSLLGEEHEVLIIERDRRRADAIAEDLGSVVLRGDACEVSTLSEAGASRADVVVAVTGDDEDNLVICQLAKKKFNAGRVVARINNPKNRRIFNLLGVDVAVSSTELILTQIQQQLPGHALVQLVKLRARDLELVEATLGPNSPLVGRTVAGAGLPAHSSLLLLLRDGEPVVPTPQTTLAAGDEVVALARTESERALRELLAG